MSTRAGNEGRSTFGLGYASFRPAEFSGTYYTTSECQGTAWRAVRQMFARYLAACGHDVGPEAVRIDARYLSAGDDGPTDGERDLVHRMARPSGCGAPR